MRVICINEHWVGHHGLPDDHPIFGNTYTVVKVEKCSCGRCDRDMYVLLETGDVYNWSVEHFAEISILDETEIHHERLKQLV